jgi:hypothetical protein
MIDEHLVSEDCRNLLERRIFGSPVRSRKLKGCESFTWVTFTLRRGGIETRSRPRFCRR